MDRLARANNWTKQKLNGRFREGDHVRYRVAGFDGKTKEYSGVITAIESDGIYIQRDGTRETDWKSAVELKKI